MRVTNLISQNNLLGHINRSKERIEDLREKIATGEKISKPSDSPGGTASIIDLNQKLNKNGIYLKNIDNSRPFMEQTASAIEDIHDEVESTLVELAKLKNPTNADTFDIIAEQVGFSIDYIFDAANREYDGKKLFGGTDQSSAPFEKDATGAVISTTDRTGTQYIKISENETVRANLTGQEVFGDLDGTDVFSLLNDVKASLEAGIAPTDDQVNALKGFNEHLLNKSTEAGNLINRMTDTSALLENQKLIYEDLLADENELDVAESIMELQNEDYVLQLAYKLSSSVLPKSLMDYL